MVISQKYGVLNHTAFKTSTLDVNVITNGCCKCSTVRIVTLTAGWTIEEPGFDAGQKQQIIITSQLHPVRYWNLIRLMHWVTGFSRGLERPHREAEY